MHKEKARQKFWERVDQHPGGHWTWRGAKVKQVYGLVAWEGSRQYVARVAWKIIKGWLPDYLELVRTCEVAGCVRPQHHYTRCMRHRRRDCPQCAGEYFVTLLRKAKEKRYGTERAA